LASRSQQVQPSPSRRPIRWASARLHLAPACRVRRRRPRQPQIRRHVRRGQVGRRAHRRIRLWRVRLLSDPMCRKPIRWASAHRHLAPACLAARARIESHERPEEFKKSGARHCASRRSPNCSATTGLGTALLFPGYDRARRVDIVKMVRLRHRGTRPETDENPQSYCQLDHISANRLLAGRFHDLIWNGTSLKPTYCGSGSCNEWYENRFQGPRACEACGRHRDRNRDCDVVCARRCPSPRFQPQPPSVQARSSIQARSSSVQARSSSVQRRCASPIIAKLSSLQRARPPPVCPLRNILQHL